MSLDTLEKAAPGVIGAVIAVLWMRESPPRVIVSSILGGSAASYYGTPALLHWYQLAPNAQGFLGFIIGLFGMALVVKVLEIITTLDVKDFWQRLLTRMGL